MVIWSREVGSIIIFQFTSTGSIHKASIVIVGCLLSYILLLIIISKSDLSISPSSYWLNHSLIRSFTCSYYIIYKSALIDHCCFEKVNIFVICLFNCLVFAVWTRYLLKLILIGTQITYTRIGISGHVRDKAFILFL